MTNQNKPAVWFPTVRTGTGTDVFTERLVEGLNQQGIRAEITWLPLRAEYLPCTVKIPHPPEWATIVHVSTWLNRRFLPQDLPIVATLHHSIHDPNLRPHKGLLRALYHQFWIAPNERRVMKQAKQVTAVSQFVSDMAKQTLCDVPIQVIYNGVDTTLFCPSNKVKEKGEPLRLLYVGAWKKLKGVDLLAPIMSELGPEFELYYTGGTSAEKDKLKMPVNMHDLGRLNQQEVIQAMQSSDLLLFPSRSEGFGLVVAEAMACGLPVVALKGTAMDELIENEVTGYLVNDSNDAVAVLKKSYMNNKILCQLSKSANEVISKKFSNRFMLDTYIHNYNQLQDHYLNR
ncbi:MAG: glycosyltransferase family 4 protein [Acinetobacter bohemicus]